MNSKYGLKHLLNSRLFYIGLSTLKSFSPLLVNFVLSVLVIRFYSENLWGRLSELLLFVNLLLLVVSWSNKDYLLRAFSKKPALIKEIFWNVFFARFILLLVILFMYTLFGAIDSESLLPLLLILLLRFLNNSFEPLYVYFKKIGSTFMADIAALAGALCLIFFFFKELNLQRLCWTIASIELIKLCWYSFLLKKEIGAPGKITIDFSFFLTAAPFFAIGVVSFMQSKSDQFLVNYFLSDSEKATYQVWTNLMLLIIALPTYLTAPFLKNIYRMKENGFKKITRRIALLGFVAVPLGVFLMYVVLYHLYRIRLEIETVLWSGLYVWPAYLFSLSIYKMFKDGEDKKVVIIFFISFLVNSIAGFILIPQYHITGGLCAAALGQWGILILILFLEWTKKYSKIN